MHAPASPHIPPLTSRQTFKPEESTHGGQCEHYSAQKLIKPGGHRRQRDRGRHREREGKGGRGSNNGKDKDGVDIKLRIGPLLKERLVINSAHVTMLNDNLKSPPPSTATSKETLKSGDAALTSHKTKEYWTSQHQNETFNDKKQGL